MTYSKLARLLLRPRLWALALLPVAAIRAYGGTPAPVPAHTVVVVEENRSYTQIIGAKAAPYVNQLARQGALFTNAHADSHPSQPNYLQLFSGSDQHVNGDDCPTRPFVTPNLGGELLAAGLTFTGYSEDLPAVGRNDCTYTAKGASYARKHSPWVDFADVPPADNRPFTDFPSDFTRLPTVAFVTPNLQHDMHDGTIAQADSWLKQHIDPYVQWAQTHNSLLVVTWDEDDNSTSANRIATFFVGPMVRTDKHQFSEKIDHYSVLRTLEQIYGLSYAGASAKAQPILDIWAPGGPGDLDGDGAVTVGDAVLALEIALGMRQATGAQLAAGDLNADGKVDMADVQLILRRAIGL